MRVLEALNEVDAGAFLWVNSHHCTVADWVLWAVSQHGCWAAVLLLAFFAFTTKTFHLSPFSFHLEKHWWLVLLAGGLCFLVADQGSVLIKNIVCRPRPCYALVDVTMFRTRCGGQYGFVSSHAANAFALLTLLWLRYRKQAPIATILLTLWALLTCYSRVYLGKHYPGDVLGGILLGFVVGWIVYRLTTLIEKNLHKSETK